MNNKIKDFREKHKLTQQQLAERIKVSRQTINSIEGGKYNPSVLLAFKIARVFHMKIEDVFIFEEK